MRHQEFFSIECEAFIVHRDEMSVLHISNLPQLPWRACVRTAHGMEWQWCKTKAEALDWIATWKKPLTHEKLTD